MAGLAVLGLAQGQTLCDQNSASECWFQSCPDLSQEVEEQKADFCAVVGTSLPCVSAQVQIEGDFLACSFSILEEQPMDMLLGLDMLKRHQVTKTLLKQLPDSCRFSEKCNMNASAVNSLGFSWGELMVDYRAAWKHVHYIQHGQL